MDINQPQMKFGLTGDKLQDCRVIATPLVHGSSVMEHFDVVLQMTTIDRERGSPVTVFMSRNHAIRLIKELASSVLANMPSTNP